MTTGEVISYALLQYVNVGATSAEKDIKLRQRAQVRLNNKASDVWAMAPWWFQMASGTVTISAGGNNGVCPSNFEGRFGTQGGVFVANNNGQPPPTYMEPAQLYALRKQIQQTSAWPWFYTLSGRDPSTNLPLLQIYPTASTAITLDLTNYVIKTPDLVDKATECVAADSGVVGLPNGAYTYVVTFVTASGETEAGVASASVTVALKKISVSSIPTSISHSVTARKLYRTQAGGSVYGLVTTIADNTTTTYTDNTADGSLGAAPPTVLTAITGTEIFPDDFHDSILLDGLIRELAVIQGDLRDRSWEDDWIKSVKQRWGVYKQGQNKTKVMPRFGVVNGYGSSPFWRWRPIT